LIEKKTAIKYRKAYESGKMAKAKGFERASPFYENYWLDWWFYAGWDCVDIDQAWAEFREENKQGMAALISGRTA